MPEPSGRIGGISAERFNHTRWSLVAAVRDGAVAGERNPLDELSQSYWFPVYACVRRSGHAPDAAFHLSGRFFAWLADEIRREAPAGFGRFRVFLFDRLQRFLAEPPPAAGPPAPAGEVEALEARLAREHAGQAHPDSIFERSFGLQVLARSRERLADETRRSGREAMFALLAPYLTREAPADALPSLATQLGIGALAVQVAIKRLRQRFRELVEAELADTVSSPSELDAERALLLRALTGAP